VDEDDICRWKEGGKLIESPIYCERRQIITFLTLNRMHRVLMSKRHLITSGYCSAANGRTTIDLPLTRKILKKLSLLTHNHPWKADFNQCTGRQLTGAVKRASQVHDPKGNAQLPFVLIGHS